VFIVWGKRKVREYLGGAAEFCPICRRVQLHGVRDVRLVGHFYWIPVGSGKVVGQECTCIGCFHRFSVPPHTYESFVDDPETDPLELMQKTNPGRLEQLSERLVLEERLRGTGQPLTPDERTKLIAEPLVTFADTVEHRFRCATGLSTGSGIMLVLTIALACGFLITAGAVAPDQSKPTAAVALGALSALSLAATVYLMATRTRRFMRRRIIPFLTRALAPLRPTEAELTAALAARADENLAIGKRLRAEWLVESMRAEQALGQPKQGLQ
jgi:hypothetical protein